jgi:DNA-binding GntR family transcriptional regulator
MPRFVHPPCLVDSLQHMATPVEQAADAEAPEPRSRAGTMVREIHALLREGILAGRYPPGSALPAQALARELGVSRTPLREAIRMLHEEGLVVVESNQRARVIDCSPEELEAVFSQRMLLSALCTRLTVPLLAEGDIERMRELERTMTHATAEHDVAAWTAADIEFHQCHYRLAPKLLRADLSQLYERALMFRTLWIDEHRFGFSIAEDDHPRILDACARGDTEAAVSATASHLTKVALTLMASLAPDRDPVVVRETLRLVSGSQSNSPLSSDQPRTRQPPPADRR